MLLDRITARHVELIDSAIGLALRADDLIELRGVEIDRRLRRRGRTREGRLAFRKRIADRGRDLHRIVMAADVHLVGRGTSAQHVIMGTGFDADQTWRQLLEERQHIAALQLTADNHLATMT